MRELTVWTFPEPGTAEGILPMLDTLIEAHVLQVDDAAVVSWPEGLRKPRTRSLGNLNGGAGELWDGTWSLLFALIFLVPLAGPTFGAAAGAVAGAVSEFGIPDDFILRVRTSVTAGTSALFVLGDASSQQGLEAALRQHDEMFGLLNCTLSDRHEQRLRIALGAA